MCAKKHSSNSHGHTPRSLGDDVKTGLLKEPLLTHPSKQHVEKFVLAVSPEPPVDIQLENHVSIFLIRGLSDSGQAWLDENVGNNETQYWGNAVVCEPRYVADIAYRAVEATLVVR